MSYKLCLLQYIILNIFHIQNSCIRCNNYFIGLFTTLSNIIKKYTRYCCSLQDSKSPKQKTKFMHVVNVTTKLNQTQASKYQAAQISAIHSIKAKSAFPCIYAYNQMKLLCFAVLSIISNISRVHWSKKYRIERRCRRSDAAGFFNVLYAALY